jgi:hypothetical protein
LPLKAVNNAIDKKTVSATVAERAGHSIRLLDLRALMSLTLERRLTVRFAPELQREITRSTKPYELEKNHDNQQPGAEPHMRTAVTAIDLLHGRRR